MSESFNFEYCRCCTCGYEWRKGLNGSHSCAENLQKQLAEAVELAYEGYDLGHQHCHEETYDLWDAKLNKLKETV
jgi:hypothetical protein